MLMLVLKLVWSLILSARRQAYAGAIVFFLLSIWGMFPIEWLGWKMAAITVGTMATSTFAGACLGVTLEFLRQNDAWLKSRYVQS